MLEDIGLEGVNPKFSLADVQRYLRREKQIDNLNKRLQGNLKPRTRRHLNFIRSRLLDRRYRHS